MPLPDRLPAPAFLLALVFLAGPAAAQGLPAIGIAIENHRFIPAEVTVPAGKRIELLIDNRDTSPEEFESVDLRREKMVTGNGKISVWVGPLPAGTYRFFGDFHQATAQGKLIAK